MSNLYDFLCKDSGITIKIRKVSPMLAADIESSIPMPLPPEQEVDYGEPKGIVNERNLSDPEYLIRLQERSGEIFQKWKRALILLGVVLEGDAWKKDVKEYRAFIQETTGHPLEETNDKLVYTLRIAIGTFEDQDDLIHAITRRSQPTAEAIEEAKTSFQRKI